MGQFALGQSVPREEDPHLLRGKGRYVDDVKAAAHGPWLCPALAARPCADRAHRRARGAADARRARGADRRRLGGRGIRRRSRRSCRASAATARPCFSRRARRWRATGRAWSAIRSPSSSPRRSIRPRTRPSASRSSTSRCRRSSAPTRARRSRARRGLGRIAPTTNASSITVGDKAAVDAAFAKAASRRRGCSMSYQPHHRQHDGAARLPRRIRHADRALHALYRRRATRRTARAPHLAAHVFNMPETAVPRRCRRCRRQLRHEGRTSSRNTRSCWCGVAQLGRPVKWVCERSEGLLSATSMTRDNVDEASSRSTRTASSWRCASQQCLPISAPISRRRAPVSPLANLGGLGRHLYDAGDLCRGVGGVHATRPATGPYRGAGRPEASYMIETHDRSSPRARWASTAPSSAAATPCRPSAMPFKTGLVYTYDSGEFREESRPGAGTWPIMTASSARRAEAKKRGKLRGIGIANIIEQTAQACGETRDVKFDPGGTLTVAHGHDLARPGPRDDVQA